MLAYVSTATFHGKWHFTLQHAVDGQLSMMLQQVSCSALGLQTSLMQFVHPC